MSDVTIKFVNKVFALIVGVALFLILTFTALLTIIYRDQQTLPGKQDITSQSNPNQLNPTLNPSPPPNQQSSSSATTTGDFNLETTLISLLAAKHQKQPYQVSINISMQTPVHAVGTVSFTPSGPGNTGHFIAAQTQQGNWTIVFDGNGTVTCEAIEPYNFSADMVPECYHQGQQALVTRVNATL
jgi:hypothetical protein